MSKERLESLVSFFTMNQKPKKLEERERLFLPVELIAEIMSWLPVKSVLKFKSVCKIWHSITKDPEFIHTHMMRSTQYIWDVQGRNSKYAIEAFYQGLVVERFCYLFSHLRLRNPSTNRFLDLPQTDDYYTSFVMPCYVSRTRTLKIILPCRNRSNDNGNFKIITAGVDDAWRTLDVPFTFKLTLYESLTVLVNGVYFIGVELDDPRRVGLPLLCLDVDSEKLWTISGPNENELGPLPGLLNWAGKPAVATSALLPEGDSCELRVWVLEDYRKQVWVKTKIIIDFPCDNSLIGFYMPYQFSENQLWMHNLFRKEELLKYDAVSNVLTRIDVPAVWGKKLRGLATLIELKGMKSIVSKKKHTFRCWASWCFCIKI